jgi:S1-C subfamily serine protease
VDIDTTLAQGGAAAGTGMVISSSGLVLTNNHVIENATTINVQVIGGSRTYSATVLGYSVTDDVALLQLQNASGLKTVSTGNSSNLSTSQPVVAIGNAGGTGGTPSAVGGTITAVNQTITAGDAGTLSETLHGLIETNANIQPGDSGGALVNTSSKVIGMNTAAAQTNGGSNQGYAIPINQAISIANQIKDGRASSTVQIGPRALLGVEVTDPSQGGGNGFSGGSGSGSTVAGAYVAGVQSGSAADNAGIGTGDTIVSINGTTITSAESLTTALLDHKPGDTVTVGWVDAEGANHSSSVQLTTGPPA